MGLDLESFKARAATGSSFALDVPALLARLAEVEADVASLQEQFAAAVDAYTAQHGQEGPSSPVSATESQDPAPGDHRHAPCGNTIANTFGTLVCELPLGHGGSHTRMQDGGLRAEWTTRSAPADQAGLDAAIEALLADEDRGPSWCYECAHDKRDAAAAAVRIAAPHIRRAALIEAADDLRARADRWIVNGGDRKSGEMIRYAAAIIRIHDAERAEWETT